DMSLHPCRPTRTKQLLPAKPEGELCHGGAIQDGLLHLFLNASASPQLDVSSPVCDVSEMDEGISELTNKMKGVLVQAVFYDLNNPFDEKIQRDILRGLKLPLSERRGFVHFDELIPRIAPHKMVQIGDTFFGMKEQIGEGAYGTIFKAIRHNNNAVNDTICEMSLVFKVQKPAREWEFYICSEVQSRLQDLGSFMAIPRCYSFSDGSIFVSEYLPASLLDILNAAKSTKMAEETFAIFFVIQLCELVHRLGQARIIHGDIKPDNIMLRRKPSLDRNAGSALHSAYDFGRGIDMSLAKEGTTFTHVFKSKETIIPEMMKEKPWSYQ
ncbi:Mitotic checkpoint serine/threonineprotein kinase BUB1 betalike, partial [Caligus rogercresseyi]